MQHSPIATHQLLIYIHMYMCLSSVCVEIAQKALNNRCCFHNFWTWGLVNNFALACDSRTDGEWRWVLADISYLHV